MKKKLFLFFSCIIMASCQKENKKPAIVNSPLKVEKESLEKTLLKYKVDENDKKIYGPSLVDSLPKYPGGMDKYHIFLTNTYVKTQESIDNEAMGGVFGTILIEKDGTLSDIQILRDFGYGSGEELLRVFKLSPNWIPAIKDGKRVRCLYSVHFYVQ